MKKLNAYDIEIMERLFSTKKPYAYRVAQIIQDKNIPIVNGYRTMAEAIIELEDKKDNLMKELMEYKQRFGGLK